MFSWAELSLAFFRAMFDEECDKVWLQGQEFAPDDDFWKMYCGV